MRERAPTLGVCGQTTRRVRPLCSLRARCPSTVLRYIYISILTSVRDFRYLRRSVYLIKGARPPRKRILYIYDSERGVLLLYWVVFRFKTQIIYIYIYIQGVPANVGGWRNFYLKCWARRCLGENEHALTGQTRGLYVCPRILLHRYYKLFWRLG